MGRLELSGYSFQFRLTSGADAGVEGEVEFSADSTFITPFVGVQYVFEMGNRLEVVPRIGFGKPFPEGEMSMRLEAPGVLLTSDSPGGEVSGFGDEFLILGLAIRDRKTKLEIDVGTMFSYAAFEDSRHEGIDDVLLITITWRK